MKPYRSEPLLKRHDRRAFSCGVDTLDRYFREQAGQDSRRAGTVVHVLIETATVEVVGFYTLTNATIRLTQLPEDVARKLPRYPTLGAVLIGRLAVSIRHQRKGIGTLLLHDAFIRCLEVAQTSALTAILVDPKDDLARDFYERHQFAPLVEDKASRMYVLLATIPKALHAAVAEARAQRETTRLQASSP